MSDVKQLMIMFSGRHIDWNVWKIRFLSVSHKNGYRNIIVGLKFGLILYACSIIEQEQNTH